MDAGKRCKGNPISTKRLGLDGVGPVDNRPSTNKDGGWSGDRDQCQVTRYVTMAFGDLPSTASMDWDQLKVLGHGHHDL